MGWEQVRVRAPRLVGDEWLNAAPAASMGAEPADGLLLVDFWDYTCVNCLRTLPYLIEWYERYSHLGLHVVGVHTPEFPFARRRDHVAAAVERLGIPYPVLLDNEERNWSAYANRAWPTKYLIDAERVIRYRAIGEGHYASTEAAIQTLLRDLHGNDLPLPSPVEPLRPTDMPGAVCFRTTPELHAGRAPGDEILTGQPDHPLDDLDDLEEGVLHRVGSWRVEQDYSESMGSDAVLHVAYRAAELNAVLTSATEEPLRLFVQQDGHPLSLGEAGEDVVVDGDLGSYVMVRRPRMYNLVINPDFASRTVTLEPSGPGLRVYAFSFVSCTKPTLEEGDIVMP
jgi:thiol-disulfide isomerase/thioredoxin